MRFVLVLLVLMFIGCNPPDFTLECGMKVWLGELNHPKEHELNNHVNMIFNVWNSKYKDINCLATTQGMYAFFEDTPYVIVPIYGTKVRGYVYDNHIKVGVSDQLPIVLGTFVHEISHAIAYDNREEYGFGATAVEHHQGVFRELGIYYEE